MAKIWLKRKFTGTPKLLLGIPAFHHLGLIHDIPGTYTIKAIEVKVPPPPLRSKEDVLEVYPNLFNGLAKLNDDAKPLCHDLLPESTLTPHSSCPMAKWGHTDVCWSN